MTLTIEMEMRTGFETLNSSELILWRLTPKVSIPKINTPAWLSYI